MNFDNWNAVSKRIVIGLMVAFSVAMIFLFLALAFTNGD